MRTATLGQAAEFINGFAFKPDDWHASGLPIVRIQNLTDSTKPVNLSNRDVPDKFRVRRGELLVSWSATLGVFVWDRTDVALVNQHIFRVVPKPDVDQGFLRYMLSGALTSMERHLHGATMKHINRAEFLSTPIPLPPLEEQRRIAAILDHADALRAKRRHILTHLDALTQSIFHDMFGGRTHPVARLDSLVDEDDRMNYGVVQPGDDVPSGVALIRVSNLVDGLVDRSDLKRISPDIESAYRRSRIRGNEILVSCVGSIGRVAVVGDEDVGSNLARAITRVPISDPVTRSYVATFLRSAAPQRYFASEVRAVAQPTLNVKQLAATELPVPPYDLQVQFAERAEQVNAQRAAVQKALEADDELFASLQSRAFKGEL